MADRIQLILQPFCERLAVAGSLRRGCPTVGDLDLVLLPRPGQLTALQARIKQSAKVETDGPQNLIVTLQNGLQVDCFFARPDTADLFGEVTPGNWGTLLLCRTGSKAHNIWLAQQALKQGLHWQPYQGLQRAGQTIAGREEKEIYQALGERWLDPGERER